MNTPADYCRSRAWGPGSILRDPIGQRVVLTAIGDINVLGRFIRKQIGELEPVEVKLHDGPTDEWTHEGRWREPRRAKEVEAG